MKRILYVCFFLMFSCSVYSQHADTLRRAAGLFISPAYTGLNNTDDTLQSSPRFGLSAGYRFVNKFKHGFFIESGINFTWLGAHYAKETQTAFAYGRNWTYSKERTTNQMFLSVPFLAGYKTQHGKVRFETSVGFSFNLMFSDFDVKNITGDYPFGIPGKTRSSDLFSFGTGFSGIVKVGISIPVTKRMCIDILPALRYHFLSFNSDTMDIIESATFDKQKWSAGVDISLIWFLDNKETETFTKEINKKNQDFTFEYNPDEKQIPIKKKLKPWGYKNYIYLEIAGNSLVYSINYERSVFNRGIFSLQARAGYGFVGTNYAIPVGINVLLGRGTKKFEMGAYATFENYFLDEFNVNVVPAMAFRWVSQEHFMLRLSMMAHVVIGTGEVIPGFGISLGGGF